MPFGRTKLQKSWFTTPLFQAGVVAICILLSALQSHAQNALPTLDFAGLVFEADELQQVEDGNTILLSGNVIVDDGVRVLLADRLTINRNERRAAASGSVTLDLGGEEPTIFADALMLDEPTTSLLLSGLSVHLRENAVLAAAKAATNGEVLTLDYVAYTACEAPCDIDLYRDRDPLPWRLTARKATLDQGTDMLHFRGLKLEVLGVPVMGLPRLSVVAPYVERRSGVLGPVAGFETGLGAWAGVPFYVTLGPSADATVTPVLYSQGSARMDFEHRVNTNRLSSKISATLDTSGRAGAMVEAQHLISATHNTALTLDWTGEFERGSLHTLDQTGLDFHENRLGLSTAPGHSFAEIAVVQDILLTTDPEWSALEGDQKWVPTARFDWRLPSFPNGSRLRVSGQGLMLEGRDLIETSATLGARAVTREGLVLTPRFDAGFIASDASGEWSPWFGAQLGASLPLARQDQHASITLTPTVAISGLTGASVSTTSPHADTVLLSRAGLFDLRASGDPYNHHHDLRADAALDFAIYPVGGKDGSGLRGSLAQRISWADTALAPTLAELQAKAGALRLDLRAEIDSAALVRPEATTAAPLPRLALDASFPLSADLKLSGRYARLRTSQDQREVNALRLDANLTRHWYSALGLSTQQTGEAAVNVDIEAELGWNFSGDWVAETAIRQSIFNRQNQDISFDLHHRCDCLGAQFGVLRERTSDGTSYSARFALDLPTLFSGKFSREFFEHR